MIEEQVEISEEFLRQVNNNEENEEILYEKVNGTPAKKSWLRIKHMKVLFRRIIPLGVFFGVGIVFYKWYENWTVLNSVYFITQTIFTIGYGNLVPSSANSRLFTVFYQLIGLGAIFQIIQGIIIGAILYAEEKTMGTWQHPVRTNILNRYYWKLLWAIGSIVIVLFIGVCGFMLLEKLPFVTALYVSTYTITTVGYGDIPIVNNSTIVFVIVFVFVSVSTTAIALSHLASAQYEYKLESKKIEMLSTELSIDLIRAYDIDGDGVGKYEFVVGALSQLGLVNTADVNMWVAKFDELDVDKNGKLDLQDLEKLKEYNRSARSIAEEFNRQKSLSFLGSLSQDFMQDDEENKKSNRTAATSKQKYLLEKVQKLSLHFDDIFRDPDMENTSPGPSGIASTLPTNRLDKSSRNRPKKKRGSASKSKDESPETDSGTYHIVGIEGRQATDPEDDEERCIAALNEGTDPFSS